MLHERQAGLRGLVRALAAESDSPQRRQALGETQTAQRDLAAEIKPLRQKIEGLLKPGGPGAKPQAGGASDVQLKKGVDALMKLSEAAGKSMLAAADRIGAARFGEARQTQAEVLEQLDQIYGAVSPLPAMLRRSIETQQAVLGGTEPARRAGEARREARHFARGGRRANGRTFGRRVRPAVRSRLGRAVGPQGRAGIEGDRRRAGSARPQAGRQESGQTGRCRGGPQAARGLEAGDAEGDRVGAQGGIGGPQGGRPARRRETARRPATPGRNR